MGGEQDQHGIRGLAGSAGDAWTVLNSVSNTLGAVLDEDGPTAGRVARAAGKDIGKTAGIAAHRTAAALAENAITRRGVGAVAARVGGSAAGGAVAAGIELGKVVVHRERRTPKDVTKAVSKAALAGALCLVATPLAGAVAHVALSAAVDRVVDAVMD